MFVCELETYCECAVWFVVVSKEMRNGILKIKKKMERERERERDDLHDTCDDA